MKNFVLNGVRSACGKSWDFAQGCQTLVSRVVSNRVSVMYLLVFGVLMLFGAGDVFAQGTNTVTFMPIVEFGTIFTTITTTIGPLVAGALGLGLPLCALLICVGKIVVCLVFTYESEKLFATYFQSQMRILSIIFRTLNR